MEGVSSFRTSPQVNFRPHIYSDSFHTVTSIVRTLFVRPYIDGSSMSGFEYHEVQNISFTNRAVIPITYTTRWSVIPVHLRITNTTSLWITCCVWNCAGTKACAKVSEIVEFAKDDKRYCLVYFYFKDCILDYIYRSSRFKYLLNCPFSILTIMVQQQYTTTF